MLPDWREYEYYCVEYLNTRGFKTHHWSSVSENLLRRSGYIHSFNAQRLTRKSNHSFKDYGCDAIIQHEKNYYPVQIKKYDSKKVSGNDLGTFLLIVMRFKMKNPLSLGYLLYSNALQIELRDDCNLLVDFLRTEKIPFIKKEKEKEEKKEEKFSLYDYQQKLLDELLDDNTEETGLDLLELFPGGGKTVICREYLQNKLKLYDVFIVAAPLKTLVSQLKSRLEDIFTDFKIFLFDTDGELNISDILLEERVVIFTTYKSLEEKITTTEIENPFIVIDEAHNLFNREKILDYIDNFDGLLLTGSYIEEISEKISIKNHVKYSISSGIENKLICDYKIYIPEESSEDKAMFLLNGMLHTGSRRIIIYLTSHEEIRTFKIELEKVCDEYHFIKNRYISFITCETKLEERRKIFKEFEEETELDKFYFLLSVFTLNEGIDLVKCDSIFISKINEKSDEITFFQRSQRGNRKLKNYPNKKNSIFVWTENYNSSLYLLDKLREEDVNFHKKIKIIDKNYDNIIENREKIKRQVKTLKETVEKRYSLKILDIDEKFYRKVLELRDFIIKEGRYPRQKFDIEKSLGNFVNRLRENYKNKHISLKKVDFVERNIENFIWRIMEKEIFENRIINLKKFVETNKKLPKYNKINKEENSLAEFIQTTKQKFKKESLTPEEIKIFLDIDENIFEIKEFKNFENRIIDLKEFVKTYKRLPKLSKINEEEYRLSQFVQRNKQKFKINKLTSEEIKIFLSIHENIFEIKERETFGERIINLKNFVEVNRRLPKYSKINKEEYSLAKFIQQTKQNYKKGNLTSEQISLFSEIIKLK